MINLVSNKDDKSINVTVTINILFVRPINIDEWYILVKVTLL